MSVTIEVTLFIDGVPTKYDPLTFPTIWHARWWKFKLYRRLFGMKFWRWPREI